MIKFEEYDYYIKPGCTDLRKGAKSILPNRFYKKQYRYRFCFTHKIKLLFYAIGNT